jgi:hypothetical protein
MSRGLLPSELTTQICRSSGVLSLLVFPLVVAVKAILDPSGDHLG